MAASSPAIPPKLENTEYKQKDGYRMKTKRGKKRNYIIKVLALVTVFPVLVMLGALKTLYKRVKRKKNRRHDVESKPEKM